MAYSKLSSYIKTVKHPDLKSKHSLTACLKKPQTSLKSLSIYMATSLTNVPYSEPRFI